MKKVIALIISIAMIASLTITSFAYSGAKVIEGGTKGTDYTVDNSSTINVLKDFSCEKIECSERELTINLNGNTLTITNQSGNGIACNNNITINGPGYLNVTASTYGIFASDWSNISIDNKATLDVTGGACGIFAAHELDIKTSCKISAKAGSGAYHTNIQKPSEPTEHGAIKINGVLLSNTDINNYFTSADEITAKVVADRVYSIYGSGKILFNAQTELENAEVEEDNSDPEVEIDFGYGPVTLKTSNNSVVFNDTKVFETNIGDGKLFVPIDLSSTPVKLDGLFFNNEVYKYIDDSGKDIEIINRFAKAEIYTNKEIGLNPLSLHLSDVSKESGLCATAIQKKAMQTSNIYAEVNYSFVSNGKPTDNEAKIYVPVDGPAKVFYLFNAEKIGIVPCEVIDGYCVFDRYFDGTYVIVAK